MPALDSLYRTKAGLWAPIYHNRETQLGATATLINFGDQEVAGKVNAATFVGKQFSASGLAPTWTPTTVMSGWGTAFDLTDPTNWQGLAPILTFAANTNERMTTPDAAYWTRALAAFSVGAWVQQVASTAGKTIMSRHDSTTGSELREWLFQIDSDEKIIFEIWDETANANIGRVYNTALAEGRWYHIVGTYSGGDTAAAIKIYIDGVRVDDIDQNSGVFVTMQNTAEVTRLGSRELASGAQEAYEGKMLGGPFCPFFTQAELTVAQIKNMYDIERHAIGV